MRYTVHGMGKGIDREHAEILGGENTSLEYVGRLARNRKGPEIKATERGLEVQDLER